MTNRCKFLSRDGDVSTAWRLLDFIEQHDGIGMGLSEVWHSVYKAALKQEKFDVAKRAFDRCLNTQSQNGPDPYMNNYRLNPTLLAVACISDAQLALDSMDNALALKYLEFLRQLATNDESRNAIAVAIDSVRKNSLRASDHIYRLVQLRRI